MSIKDRFKSKKGVAALIGAVSFLIWALTGFEVPAEIAGQGAEVLEGFLLEAE